MGDLRPSLIVFKELTEDDKQKLEGKAKYAESGGGARDFRFNYKGFADVFGRMWSGRTPTSGSRVVIHGELTEPNDPRNPNGPTSPRSIKFMPPTPSRPAEGRIGRSYTYQSFQRYPRDAQGRIYLLIIQLKDGQVRAEYVTEQSLRSDDWDPLVSGTILNCAFSNRRGAIMGWIDFTTGKTYCHA